MTVLPVLAAGVLVFLVRGLFIFCALALILVVLIQKGRGGGLSSAFGGGMASNILGSKTGDFLTWVTIALVTCFLVSAVVLAKWDKPSVSGGAVQPVSAETADVNVTENGPAEGTVE